MRLPGGRGEAVRQARAAKAAGITATTIVTIGSIPLLAFSALLWWNTRQRHVETMALLLAFSAKSGLSMEELEKALEAVEAGG